MKENEGYCVKCKAPTDMGKTKTVKMKNGRMALRGSCKRCDTRVWRILPLELRDDVDNPSRTLQ